MNADARGVIDQINWSSIPDAKQRKQVLEEAFTWYATPYHHEAQVKGAGVDCGKLLIGVFSAVGIMPNVEPAHYPPDFMLHRDFEWYKKIVEIFATQIKVSPLPGDVVLFKIGRLFAHGAIVVEWPIVIHAWAARGQVCYANATDSALGDREQKYYCPYGRRKKRPTEGDMIAALGGEGRGT